MQDLYKAGIEHPRVHTRDFLGHTWASQDARFIQGQALSIQGYIPGIFEAYM
jgi:hypothetical protein